MTHKHEHSWQNFHVNPKLEDFDYPDRNPSYWTVLILMSALVALGLIAVAVLIH